MTNINKTIEDFDKKYITNSKCNGGGCCIKLNKHSLKDFIIKALKAQEQEHQKKLEEILIDQLQRFRGVLGKYR